jgi:hypothetical protein
MTAKFELQILLHRLRNHTDCMVFVIAKCRYYQMLDMTAKVVNEDGYFALSAFTQIATVVRSCSVRAAYLAMIADLVVRLSVAEWLAADKHVVAATCAATSSAVIIIRVSSNKYLMHIV